MRDERRADSILADWLERRDRGEAADPVAVIRDHPDLAEILEGRFAALDLVDLALSSLPPQPPEFPEPAS